MSVGNRITRLSIVVVILIGLLGGGGQALGDLSKETIVLSGTLVHMEEADLTELSNVIIEGMVVGILPSRWNTPTGAEPEEISSDDAIYTDNIIKVNRVRKGSVNVGDNLTVRTLGGEYSGARRVRAMVSDMGPRFVRGERVLLFLSYDDSPYNKNQDNAYYIVTGSAQGKICLG